MKNLCEIKTITSGSYHYSHSYPTCKTWTNDSKSVFVEYAIQEPDKRFIHNLSSIEIDTLKESVLASFESPYEGKPGGGFIFDFAPGANCIVYSEPTAKKIYLLNLDTKKSGLVLDENEGVLGGPLAIAYDGTRISYWVMYPSIANRFFDNYITVIFTIDLDPETCKAISEPRIAEAYPRRKLGDWEKNNRAGIHVNHCQINPKNREHIIFAHEMLGAEPDGSVAMCRLWQSMADEDKKTYLIRQPKGLHFTHEVIAPDGKSLIFPYMHGIGQVYFDTFESRSIYFNPDCCPGHLTVSSDMKWITGDTWNRQKDESGKTIQSLMLLEIETRKFAHLCWFNFSHPHPNFSPDGGKIAFTYINDDGFNQIGVVDISDIKQNWERYYQGIGDTTSPHWR